MLRPQDTETRERKSLDGLWAFALDPNGDGRDGRWFAGPLGNAREMAVPASFNDITADPAVRDYFGDLWYQTTVRVPRGWAGQRILLRFESATHRATVWVNDVEVVSHEGGYTPFEADITDQVSSGAEARVTIVVNNTLSFQSIPPGVIEDTPAGKRQRYWHDFFNYAGIHRSVWLYSTPDRHITDITVVPGLDGATGTVEYTVEATGDAETRVVLRDAQAAAGRGRRRAGRDADRGERAPLGARRRLPLRPGGAAGRRGRRRGQLPPERGRPHRRRSSGNRFLINGEPFYFTGFGMHEDHAVLRQGAQRRAHAARLRAAGVDRRELVPYLALSVLRGRPGLRGPARHRHHRRDRRPWG